LHNDLPAHSATTVKYFLSNCGTIDLVPVDFFLLLEAKMLSKKADFRTLRISSRR
jgi:hypothetical protein